jgi:hypothetical protein
MTWGKPLLLALSLVLAVAAPLAYASAAGETCAMAGMTGDHDPCNDCGAAPGCAFACGLGSSAPVPVAAQFDFAIAGGSVSAGLPAHFASIAGPPGLQPPR